MLAYAIVFPHGIPKPYVTLAELAINRAFYKDKCLVRKLVPYLSKLPKNTQYMFCKDMFLKKRPLISKRPNFAKIWKSSKYPRNTLYRGFLEFNQRRSIQGWMGRRKFGPAKTVKKNGFDHTLDSWVIT